jgi:CheY-like chemotaxis protein
MDVQMPVMDGYTATRTLREREKQAGGSRRTPVIGVTAHALMEHRAKCIAAGMDEYISKPFKPDELADVLAKVIRAN